MILRTLYKFKVGKYLVSIEGLVINQVQHRLLNLLGLSYRQRRYLGSL